MTPARFRWGMLLILIGTLVLLRNFDVLEYNFWWDFIIYFPLFLIAVGIEKIFTGSRMEFISYLTTVALVGGAAFVALEGAESSEASFFSQTTYTQEADPSAESLRAVLHLGSGDLTIRDAGDNMVYGRFREFTRKPKISYSLKGDQAEVVFDSRSGRFFSGLVQVESDDPDDWYLSFSDHVPLSLECSGDHSDIHMNLSTTPLRDLRLEADDAEIYLKIGDLLPFVSVTVKGDESKLRLRVPRDVGLRVSGAEHRNLLKRIGLKEDSGFFVNDGFDTLKRKIEIDLGDRFRSLSLDFY
ncbi:MAG TPA: DUF5668 domain-containing protein [Acidobacteriota bacterium]|nr:DUF5668 domain-containing protein [Acidobacteriota bacterium]